MLADRFDKVFKGWNIFLDIQEGHPMMICAINLTVV